MLLTLRDIIPQAGNATTFVFTPNEPLNWEAGNSFHLEVMGDYAPIEHTFTISSAPAEGVVAVTTRPSSSPYKRSLFSLKPDDTVVGTAFGGTFTWRQTTLTPVFLASGIGITPFRAMLTQHALTGRNVAATLIYASANNDIIFKDELDELAAQHPDFAVTYVVGERLSLRHIKKHIDINKNLFYISGPSAMVDDMSSGLQTQGVPDTQLVRDWFTGRFPDSLE